MGRTVVNRAITPRLTRRSRRLIWTITAVSEYEIHCLIVDYLRISLPAGSMVHHSPNEGKRTVSYHRKLARQGLLKGYPDLEVIIPQSAWPSGSAGQSPWAPIFFEVKSAKGRVSPAQRAAHELLEACGCHVYVVRSLDETMSALSRHVGRAL